MSAMLTDTNYGKLHMLILMFVASGIGYHMYFRCGLAIALLKYEARQ